MVRWFRGLPLRRKFLLFLAGGMVSLVFDAFVAHFSWNARSMKWTQAVPIIYGLFASVALTAGAFLPSATASGARMLRLVGGLGLLIGGTGVILHGIVLVESLEGEPLGVITIGKALSLAPPLFAPAAFAGVGLLLVALPWFTPAAQSGQEALDVTLAEAARASSS